MNAVGIDVSEGKSMICVMRPLLDQTFPDANRLFCSSRRADGSEKWVDFVAEFWHCECVCGLSEKSFVGRYQKWCKKHGYLGQYRTDFKVHNVPPVAATGLLHPAAAKISVKPCMQTYW